MIEDPSWRELDGIDVLRNQPVENGLIGGGATLSSDGCTLNVGRICIGPEHFRKGLET